MLRTHKRAAIITSRVIKSIPDEYREAHFDSIWPKRSRSNRTQTYFCCVIMSGGVCVELPSETIVPVVPPSIVSSSSSPSTAVPPSENEPTMPYPLPLDKPVPSYVLGRRRCAISGGLSTVSTDSPYCSQPRMKRRGAISFERSDSAAQYIRYLGDALSKREELDRSQHEELPELPTGTRYGELPATRRSGRRGSMQQNSPSQCYKAMQKGNILQRIGVEGHARMIQDNLRKVDNWNFDIFAFRRITEGRPLYFMGLHLLHKHNLIDTLKLDILKVMKFLALVEQGYHTDNCYHNSTHATDVTQALHCLISEEKLYSHLTPLEVLASILGAMCHDLDHPGVNQNYLLNTSSYLASIHGSHSLLERHHCHAARAVLRESHLLDHFSPEQKGEVFALMEDLILATDVNRHKDFMARFEEMLVSPQGIDLSNPAERHFMLMIAIKSADISNPSRILTLSRTWSYYIMEEFFRQGDNERKLKLPISFLCDRLTTGIPKSQSCFFEFVALPLFKAWSKFFATDFSIQLCQNIVQNKAYWDDQLAASSDSDSDTS